jgi:hypothetical protein
MGDGVVAVQSPNGEPRPVGAAQSACVYKQRHGRQARLE